MRLSDAVSKAQPVTFGVIQETVINPVLFTIFINPLLIALEELAYAFAGDIKYVSKATASNKIRVQQAIGTLEQWTVTYLMSLSLDKCIVLHCGTNNPCYIYTCNGMPLTVVDVLNDLGVMRSNSECGGYQSATVVAKAHRTSGLILRVFHSSNVSLMWQAFCTYVIPLLMYASPCWSPRLRRDVTALESVQRHFTLRHLHALPLEDMRTIADLRLTYKCLHRLYHVSLEDIGLSYQMGITIGAEVRLTILRANNSVAKSFYKFRLPIIWNVLPLSTIASNSLLSFNHAVYNRFYNNFTTGFEKVLDCFI